MKRDRNRNRELDMQKTLQLLLRFAACLIVITVGSYVIVAQSTVTGTWKADTSQKKKTKERHDDKSGEYGFEFDESDREIHINFKYESSRGSSSHGTGFNYDDLEGLSRSQAEGGAGAVRFRIVRDAGTIDCTGNFSDGTGSGTFTFTANSGYRSQMSSRGFEFSDEKMFSAAILDVTVSLADDLSASGFTGLDVDDLFKAKIFRIDSTFMREMAATGYPDLDMEDLVKARIFKIDAAFVRDVVAMGFQTKSFEELVKFRIFKITPDYLREMQTAGFPSLSSEQAVKLRIFKVTPEFIREMQGEGLANLSVEEAVKLRIFNVSSDFVRDARANGETNLSVENLVKLKIHGKIR